MPGGGLIPYPALIALLKSHLGLLALGKTDFEALSNYKDDPFFREALGLQRLPSAVRMRQRMDESAEDYRVAIDLNP